MCTIDVEFFPFDGQTCEMKFGSWTYGGLEVDLKHKEASLERIQFVAAPAPVFKEKQWVVDDGIDLSGYYPSVEWDILAVPAIRHEKRYPCCDSAFIDITYELRLRRKALFYTVNLIFPSVGISFLTALVFYLPVIPLIGKYLLFTMVLVTLSVVVTVITLNVHYRSPTTHSMPWWMRKVFIDILPRLLNVNRPDPGNKEGQRIFHAPKEAQPRVSVFGDYLTPPSFFSKKDSSSSVNSSGRKSGEGLDSAVDSVCYIAEHLKSGEDDQQVMEDWKYVAMVLDRLFLLIFTMVCIFGTASIIFRAPTIYDTSVPIA